MGRVFDSRSVRVYAVHSCYCEDKRPSLKLKTCQVQLFDHLLLDPVLPSPCRNFLRQIFIKIAFLKTSLPSLNGTCKPIETIVYKQKDQICAAIAWTILL